MTSISVTQSTRSTDNSVNIISSNQFGATCPTEAEHNDMAKCRKQNTNKSKTWQKFQRDSMCMRPVYSTYCVPECIALHSNNKPDKTAINSYFEQFCKVYFLSKLISETF